MHLDEAVPRALRSLLGKQWQDRLKRAVAREMQPPKPEPKRRNLTDEQREARRQSMLAINAAKAAAKADMTDPALTAAEVHEARDKLAKGEGALELQDWFGGGLGWWQAWCERERRAA